MEPTQSTSRVRAILDPVTNRLERLERRAAANSAELERIKMAARAAGLRGARYGLLMALAVASPKDAIKQLLGYLDAADAEAAEPGTEVAVADLAAMPSDEA